MEPIRIAVLTVSDGVTAGVREDLSGAAIRDWVVAEGHVLVESAHVPDASEAVAAALTRWSDSGEADVVLTTGGTGLTRRDVTPEATLAVLEREAPGIAEALRAEGRAATPFASLSRGVAGTRGTTLIVNLPGSEKAVREGLGVLAPLLGHAVQLLRGVDTSRHEAADG